MTIQKPGFSLTIGGLSSTTDNPVAGPMEIVVERDMDIPADSLRVRLMERADVVLGDDIVLKLGTDDQQAQVFTGKVAFLRPALAGVEIIGLGTMNDLLNFRTASVYQDQSAGSIANDLISRAGLDAGTVDDGPTLPRYAVDKQLSAYSHLRQLANRLGYELYADHEGKIMFHALGPAADLDASAGGLLGAAAGAAALLGLGGGGEGYAFGKHLVNSEARRKPAAWGKIQVGGESPMSGQGDKTADWLTVNDHDYRGEAGDGVPELLILDPAARTQDLANRFAAGYLAVAQRVYAVQLTVLGRAKIDLGDSITLSDAPDESLNGDGYIRALRHRFGKGVGFLTDLRIALDATA